ncbi:MAG: winged helix-turn-helix domain-containing protein [Paraglaciecola sp.]|uniref:winged helix-turn-helix domain-containing protein n=1 Tax=Paraglaciecola sp. TaxID=1920173 RepID=UPI003266ECAA
MDLRNYNYKVGDWYVDVSSSVLFDSVSQSSANNTTEISLEPKALAVLTILLEAQGAVVTRETLLDRVWSGRFVTDYALNNVISTLRKHLSPNDRSKYIVTRPKIGYQLAVKVSYFEQQSPTSYVSDASSTQITDANTNNTAHIKKISANYQNVGDGTLSVSPKRWRSHLAWFVGIAILISVGVFFSIDDTNSNDNTRIPSPQISIAILPFDLTDKNAELAFLASGLPREVISELSINSNILVLDRRSTFSLREEDKNPVTVSENLGVDYILTGSLAKGTTETEINVVLFDELGNEVWQANYQVDASTIFTVQDDIVQSVYEKINEPPPTTNAQNTKYIRSDNPEAFMHWMNGRALNQDPTRQARQQGILEFKKAITLDPNFASAYVDLAIAYLVVHSNKELSLEDANAAAKPLLDNADLISPSLPAITSARGVFAMYNGQTNKAIGYYNEALTLNPNDYLARSNLAYLFKRENQRDEALYHYRLARQLAPLAQYSNWAIGRLLLELGKVKEANDQLEKCVLFVAVAKSCHLELAFLQRLIGEPENAAATFAQVLANEANKGDYWIKQNKGFHAWWNGDAQSALAVFDELYEQHGSEYSFIATYAWIKWQLNDYETLQQNLQQNYFENSAALSVDGVEALMLMAYADGDCDTVFTLFDKRNTMNPSKSENFTAYMEGFSYDLNIAACYIKQGQPQLALPLIRSVEVKLQATKDTNMNAPGVLLIQAKLDKLRGKSVDIEALSERLESQFFPHIWMFQKDWAFD